VIVAVQLQVNRTLDKPAVIDVHNELAERMHSFRRGICRAPVPDHGKCKDVARANLDRRARACSCRRRIQSDANRLQESRRNEYGIALKHARVAVAGGSTFDSYAIILGNEAIDDDISNIRNGTFLNQTRQRCAGFENEIVRAAIETESTAPAEFLFTSIGA